MQPGNFGPGQDPYGQPQYGQPPQYSDPQYGQYAPPPQYSDPQYGQSPQYGEPQYGQQPQYSDPQYGQQPPQYGDQAAQQAPYADPYAQQYPPSPGPTTGSPYPVTGAPYPVSGAQQPMDPGYAGYAVPGYGAAPSQNSLALIGMIMGIVALPLSLCCGLFSSPFNIAAIVLGILGLKKAGETGGTGKGQALAALICGGISLVLMVIIFTIGIGLNLSEQFGS